MPSSSSHSFAIPSAIGEALRRAWGEQLPSMTLAALEVLLFRYTGEAQLLIHCQRSTEKARVRTDLSGEPSFTALVDRVRAAWSRPDAGESPHPFQISFNYDVARPEAGDADLTLSLEDTGGALIGAWSGDRKQLFDEETFARFAQSFEVLLRSIAANPERSIERLSILGEEERRRLLVDWNQTAVPRSPALFSTRFEAQVEQTPDAVALSFSGVQLSYRELNEKANQLALRLRKDGVRPGVLVGLCVTRSLEMVVGIFGILKAGGAFIPLDPSYPKDRLRYMLEDSGTALLLTQAQLLAELPSFGGRVLCLDRDWPEIAGLAKSNPRHELRPEHSAYVIYTSGSTGKPKGVLVSHRGLCNLADAQIETFAVTRQSRVLQFASFSFDASVSEVAMAVLAGAQLCLATREELMPGPALVSLLRDQGITTVTLPPSVLAALPSDQLPTLTSIATAGEACSAELVTAWSKGRRFINAYGPSEATVCSTMGICTPSDRRPSIGRPIANTQAYVLDRHLQPVPVGVAGELHVGGISLADGYLHQPQLTATKFVPDPFSGQAGARLYKTGDLVRHLPGGDIDFLGRIDHQVKIRGFRIELGEIEARVREYPKVKDVVVLVRDDPGQEKRIVAYVIAADELNVSVLRAFLRERLPEFMLPSAIVFLSAFPLSPNGKIDLRALPLPSKDRPALGTAYVEPRDDLERALVGVWEDLLGVHPIGVADDFFDLGGHSLLAIRLLTAIEKSYQRQLSLSDLVQGGTIQHLSAVLRERPSTALPTALVPIRATGKRPPFFCIHPVSGNVLCYLDLVRQLDPDQPVYGLQATSLLGGEPLRTVEEMASAYIQAMKQVQPKGPYQLGGWSAGGTIAFETACQLQQGGDELSVLAMIDSLTPAASKGDPVDAMELDSTLAAYMFVRNLARAANKPLTAELADFAKLDGEPLLVQIRSITTRYQVLPGDITLPQVDVLFRTFAAILYAVNQGYDWSNRYRGHVTLFQAQDGHPDHKPPRGLGWDEYTTEPTLVHDVPGTHYSLVYKPNVEGLARALSSCLAPRHG